MRRLWRDYSLGILLLVGFLGSWGLQAVFQYEEVAQAAAQHHQAFRVHDFVVAFLRSTFENWQSEFLQLFSFVALATWFVFRNSPQSRDGDDRRDEQLATILDRLERIEAKLREPAASE